LCIGGFPFDDHSLATITQEGLLCTVILFQNMLSLTLLGMMCRRLRCQRDSQREAEIFAASFAEDIPFRNNVSYSCTGARSDNHDSFCTSAHDVQEAVVSRPSIDSHLSSFNKPRWLEALQQPINDFAHREVQPQDDFRALNPSDCPASPQIANSSCSSSPNHQSQSSKRNPAVTQVVAERIINQLNRKHHPAPFPFEVARSASEVSLGSTFAQSDSCGASEGEGVEGWSLGVLGSGFDYGIHHDA
jgi:hypothetical protein